MDECEHYVSAEGNHINVKTCDPDPTYYLRCSGCGWPLTVFILSKDES